jgi:Zn-dependent peptidase ImmA (M78 family)
MKRTIKKLLKEALFDKNSKKQIELLEEFIKFVCKELKVKKLPVHLQFNHEGLVTTADYGGKKIHVYAKERALVDIMRSLAHEYTHYKQDVHGHLNAKDHQKNNKAGSPIEDEANFKAGELIRKFGEIHPEIYP